MKNPIVSIHADTITLSSSLNADAFSKVNPTRLLDEAGFVATVPQQNLSTTDVTFAEWRFTGTEVSADGIALFTGTSFGAGKTLYDLFAGKDTDASTRAAITVCTALSAAIAQGISLDATGAEGIVLFEEAEQTRVLFLPPIMFERCANNTKDCAADFFGFYVHKGLAGKNALLFMRAVIAYRALCGTLPYTETDISRRQADIFDARFVPMYLMRADIDATLASAIDCGLQVRAEPRVAPGERRYVNEKETERRKKLIAAAEAFSLPDFAAACQHSPAPDNALMSQRNAFVAKQTATVRRKRFFRRNYSRIVAALIAAVLGVWAITSFERENRTLATSKGLTSWETTQALYATIHQANVPHLQELAKGKNVKNLRQIISGFYVTNRSRSAMNQDEGTVSPAEWLFLKNKTKFWQYGLTHLRIDGKEADSSFAYPVRADKPQKRTEEEGVTLKNGATKQHTATYYLVNNDGSARISVNTVTDTVTLTWKRGRWLVTNIQSKSKSAVLFTKDFYADYQAALDATGEDIFQTAAILRASYDWIPTDAELRAGKASLEKRMRTHAF